MAISILTHGMLLINHSDLNQQGLVMKLVMHVLALLIYKLITPIQVPEVLQHSLTK